MNAHTDFKTSIKTDMMAFVYQGQGKTAFVEHAKPEITAPTDAIVKIVKTTICGTNLHILKGDVATCKPARILGHEGVGVIETVGEAVTSPDGRRRCRP